MNAEPLTIADAAPLIRRGDLTPSDVLEQCLARVDRYEPRVRAWVYLDRERARQDAARLTDEVKAGHYRGPLHGIPVGIKDIIDVFDMPTGCGSKLWANSYARRDATSVERLRQAGVVVVGKMVTTPFAYIDPPPTRNPWNPDRTPGGSSSGSAAAVACGMVLAALGTQTGGSVTRPASYCGVCSLKPTHGRVSVDGVLPFAPSLDHVGVMANCVRDLATVFEVIARPPGRAGWHSATSAVPSCLIRMDDSDTAPSVDRLGGTFDTGCSPGLRPLHEQAMHALGEGLLDMERVVPTAGFAELLRAHRIIMSVESAAYHGERRRRHPDDYPTHIAQLIEEGERTAAVELSDALQLREELSEQVDQMMEHDRLFVTPATTDLPPGRETTGSPAFNAPWSFTGNPTISIPVGWSDDGLPYAVQIVGRRTYEDDLLTAAVWCEKLFARPRRLPPVP